MLVYQVKDDFVCRKITLACNLPHYGFIGKIIIIIMINPQIKKPVSLQPEWLMNLEI
jgi:hypothetical protein